MTLLTGKPNKQSRRKAFTLIELILVLVLLTIVISLVIPSMSKFFGGRALDSEVRQFVALTHYAQSRAASEGVPMYLWIDAKNGAYGLEEEPGYTDSDPKAEKFNLSEGLKINFRNATKSSRPGKNTGIHFSPDGNVITATSVPAVSIQRGNENPVWISQSDNGLGYEVR